MSRDPNRLPDAFEQFTSRFPDARWSFTTENTKIGIRVAGYHLAGQLILVVEQYSFGERADWWNVFTPVTMSNSVPDTWAAVERWVEPRTVDL